MTGQEIRQRREALGMDRTAFAAYLGVSYWTVAQWESGKRSVTMDEFSLKVALYTAEKALRERRSIPDWREEPVFPGLAVVPDQELAVGEGAERP